jgi:hypothetical protein
MTCLRDASSNAKHSCAIALPWNAQCLVVNNFFHEVFHSYTQYRNDAKMRFARSTVAVHDTLKTG